MKEFNSPTEGKITFYDVIESIIDYMDLKPRRRYRIVVGTDSQVHAQMVDFVCVIALHRIGNGGRYFWYKQRVKRVFTLRNRIYEEATLSLKLARKMVVALEPAIKKDDNHSYDLEIHVDIGPNGPTRLMIQEIIGMIRGSGFAVRTKPEAYGAFVVADKYT